MPWVVGIVVALVLFAQFYSLHPEVVWLIILVIVALIPLAVYQLIREKRQRDAIHYDRPPSITEDEFIRRLELSPRIRALPTIEAELRRFYQRRAPRPKPADDDEEDDTYALAQSFGRAFWTPDHICHQIEPARQQLSLFEASLPPQPSEGLFPILFNPPDWDAFVKPLTDLGLSYRVGKEPFPIPASLGIPRHSWFEGSWVVAPSGRGKTTLLKYLVTKVPEPDACIILMDAKGELLQSFNQLAQWKDRYVYLQPSAEYPLAINPLEIGHSVEFLEYIFSALLESKMTPNQSTLFRMVLTLCKVIPNANLETFRLILSRGPKEFEQYVRKLKPRDQDFFDLEWKERIYAERRPEVLARLRTLMTHDALDAILQAPHTKIDLGQLMDEGKIICINNNYEDLGEQGCEFFGRLFISLVWAAARKRSQRTGYKRPVYFFIDEAHYVIARDTKISTILNQCRAQNISMLFAHQQVQQIKDDDVKAALNDCAIKFANSSGEAHELAPRLETTPDFLKAQKRGQFALHVRDTTPTAVSVSVTPVDLNQYPKLSRDEIEAILRNTISRYCYQYTEQTYSETKEEPPAPDGTLYWKRTLSPKLAVKGGYHNVPVTDEKGNPKILRVTIKPGTKHGDKVRIKGYGALKKDRTRGDVIIEWIIPQRPDKTEQHSKEAQYQPFGIPPPDREERW